MSKWSQIHSDVHISGADGFKFVVMPVPHHEWHVDMLSEEEKEFVAICLPGAKPRMIGGVERPYEPEQALRMYLCESMSNTFALGTMMVDYKKHFIIGTRSQKDMFKVKLKFPETTDRKIWGRDQKFYVRVSDGDVFSDDGTTKNMEWEKYNV